MPKQILRLAEIALECLLDEVTPDEAAPDESQIREEILANNLLYDEEGAIAYFTPCRRIRISHGRT
jgi:hypothetical protein